MSEKSSSRRSRGNRSKPPQSEETEDKFYSTIAKIVDERKVHSVTPATHRGALWIARTATAGMSLLSENVDERAKALSRKLRSDMKSNQTNENSRFMNLMMMAMMMSNQTTILQRPKLMQTSEEPKTMPSEFTPMKILQNLGIPLNDQASPMLANMPPAGFQQVVSGRQRTSCSRWSLRRIG